MAYNFKNLADVELLNAMPEEANVVVEVNGTTKRAPQVKPVDEIAMIVGSETLEEVPEGATVLAEVNGEIKRVPSDGLGGGKALIIKSSDFDNAMVSVAKAGDPEVTYSANMTYDEMMEAFTACELIGGFVFLVTEGMAVRTPVVIMEYNVTSYIVPCVELLAVFVNGAVQLYWTAADGISTTEPESAMQGS